MDNIANLRKEYSEQGLLESEIPPSPFALFKIWFEQACETNEHEPNAMCLSTVGKDLKPSARFVLLKGFDEKGFVFYTNYESKKSN